MRSLFGLLGICALEKPDLQTPDPINDSLAVIARCSCSGWDAIVQVILAPSIPSVRCAYCR